MPADRPFRVRPLTASDADAVKQLWSARFGGAPATQDRWIEAAVNPDHTAIGTVATTSSRSVAGFGMLDVGAPEYTRRYLSLDALDLDVDLAPRNGIFHMYCVHVECEGRGIGSALYAHHLDHLAKEEVPRAFGIAWHRPHTVDSRALFDTNGFTRLTTVDRYYGRFEGRPHCPDCEEDCTCTASLYARRIALDDRPKQTT